MGLFDIFKKKKSIYKILLENNFDLVGLSEIKNLNLSDGSYELRVLKREEKINNIKTRELNKALDDYYLRDSKAIEDSRSREKFFDFPTSKNRIWRK